MPRLSVWLHGLFLAVLVCQAALGGEAKENVLWRAYAEGPPERQALLAEALQRVDNVCQERRAEAADWPTDADVRWLSDHRTVAMLAVGHALDGGPADAAVPGLARLIGTMGTGWLTRRLPALLDHANSDGARLAVLRAMADARDTSCQAALSGFLSQAGARTSEALICEAARGLGHAGDKEYNTVLRKAYGLVRSRQARVRVAAARYLCGERGILPEVLRALSPDETDKELQAWVLEFVAENPAEESVPALEELALRKAAGPVGAVALRVLMHVTAYGVPQQAPQTAPDEEGTEPAPVADEPQQRAPEQLSPQQRAEQVRQVVDWWRGRQEAGGEAAESIAGGKEALPAR
jgi:hypothetical protein